MPRDLFGILNIHKPPGLTSRRVVDRVVHVSGRAKAGHAGTLDPLATGVLVVCLGKATRLIEYIQDLPKRYVGGFLLGRESTTEDVEGEITELVDPPQPARSEIERACGAFLGEIQQRPPAFSALKVAGQRAYKLARAGEIVELAPRPVTIYRLEVAAYDYPRLTLNIECSGGTYVRSLGRDLAASLGTAAVMESLVRSAIGGFTIEKAVQLDSLTPDNLEQHLLPPITAVEHLPRIIVTPEEQSRLSRGQSIECPASTGQAFAALNAPGQLLAILQRDPRGQLRPAPNFAT